MSAKPAAPYALATTVQLPWAEAVARTRDALAEEGFGVLTEIDVRETLKQKIDVDFRPYIILGACNPPLAHQALKAEVDIGLLLPCNVVVYAADDAGTTAVAAIDPVAQLSIAANDAVEPLAREVRARLERVVEAVSSS